MEYLSNALNSLLGQLMSLCYWLIGNYGLSIIAFTLITKVILFPVNIIIQKNSIKMVQLMPEQNALKIKYIDDPDKYTDEQIALYKRHKYNPMLGVLPLLIQIPLVLGLVGVIYRPLTYVLHIDESIINSMNDWLVSSVGVTDAGDLYQLEIMRCLQSGIFPDNPALSQAVSEIMALDLNFMGINLGLTPSFSGNYELLLIPLLSGVSAWFLCVMQNKFNILQVSQGNLNKYGTTIFMIAFSTYFAFLVPAGVGIYWIFGNLFAVPSMLILNMIIPPQKYVDYDYLIKMQEQRRIKEELHKKNLSREKKDYKAFFAVEDMQLMFYSEQNGFYKYYSGMIDYICEHSDIHIHYVTSDPDDNIFNDPREQIHAYYIASDRYLIPTFMKLDCDMCVMTMSDLEKYHIKRSRVRKDIEYVYVCHGIGSINLTMRKGALDWYDTVFCPGIHIVNELRQMEEYYKTPAKRLVETGYVAIDEMLKAYENNEHKKNDRDMILVAPSWQPDNIIDLCGEELIGALSKLDCDIIVRPHPQHVRHSPERFVELKQKYETEGSNIMIQTDFSSSTSVMDADLIITDWSDISFEYAFVTKKPVLYINTPMKVLNHEYKNIAEVPIHIHLREVIGKSMEVADIPQIESVIAEINSRRSKYREDINDAFEKYIFNIGKSSILSGKYIIKSLKKEI